MNYIKFFFEETDIFDIPEFSLKVQIEELISTELKVIGAICIIFCSDDYLRYINKKYLNRDYYTDIITFNYVNNNSISGDLFISVDRVRDNANIYKTIFYEELYRVIFHGILHLIGYNDSTLEEKKLMKAKEDHYLKKVDFPSMMR